jgi:hypothetical protein
VYAFVHFSFFKIVAINQNQFIQSIVDGMTTRLCSRSEDENYQLLSDISALDLNNIKTGSSASIRYGELELLRICRCFDVDESCSRIKNL